METVTDDAAERTDAPLDLLTVPNALSVLRLLGIPVFLWLVLGVHHEVIALWVLVAAGLTDWLDGWLARRLRQESRFGAILDPVADRLYIFAVVVALALRHYVPWWLAVVLPLRDAMLWCLLPALRSRGRISLPVHFLGKAATFNLLYAFPLLFLGRGDGTGHELARVFGWSFAIWGIGLYWWAGVIYVGQVRHLVATVPRRPGRGAGERT